MKLSILASTLAAATLAAVSPASADTTAQALPFAQDWTNTELITTDDTWTGVPGVTGYRGDSLTSSTGTDPQTLLVLDAVVDVNANETDPDFGMAAGGVTEFHDGTNVTSATVALSGSGTADAPSIVIAINTTGARAVRVQYDLIDLDGSTDNAAQQVALQYRIGNTGNFINVPAGYVADATTGPSLKGETHHVDVTLPLDAGNQPEVDIRVITTNAGGNDEFVAIDNISIVETSAPPTAEGQALPPMQVAGGAIHLMAEVTGGTLPASTGIAVSCDLTAIGGSATETLFDDGAHDDGAADDGHFGVNATIGASIAAGQKTLTCTVSDAENRSSTFDIALTVVAVCGDGRVEGTEACDDDEIDDGDGCSATCTIESGYSCEGSPSVCTDIDECATQTDNCDDHATCTNTPVGSFTCTCNEGYEGSGTTCAPVCGDGVDVEGEGCDDGDTDAGDGCSATCTTEPGYTCTGSPSVCTDIDECALNTDNCSAFATCNNAPPGSFSCTCLAGYSGNGVTCSPVCGDDLVVTGEGCDDGGQEGGDGCSGICAVEDGWACIGMPSDCTTICGDGLVLGAEGCDDAGTDPDDGCAADCQVEDGWNCTGEPSTCSPAALCGDGTVDAGEECDDDNDTSEDGCDATCTVEDGWLCDDAAPTVCVEDSDGDQVPDADDNCPTVANPSQFDSDEDGVGTACDDDEGGTPDDTGCCSASHDDRSLAGFGLLALLTVFALRRRRAH